MYIFISLLTGHNVLGIIISKSTIFLHAKNKKLKIFIPTENNLYRIEIRKDLNWHTQQKFIFIHF